MPTNLLVTQFNLASNARLPTDIIPIVQDADLHTGVATYTPLSAMNALYWSTTGNAATVAGTNFIGTTDAIDFVMKTDGVEAIRIKSNQHIGIGQPSPTVLLHVGPGTSLGTELLSVTKNQNAFTGASILNQVAGTASVAGLVIGSDVTSINLYSLSSTFTSTGIFQATSSALVTFSGSFQIGSADSNPVRFYTNNTEAARISPTGNFGIGQVAPTVLLHVGPSAAAGYETVSVSHNQNGLTALVVNNDTIGTSARSMLYLQGDGGNNLIISCTNTGYTPASGMNIAATTSIQSGAPLNIGTNTPSNVFIWANTIKQLAIINDNISGNYDTVLNATGSALTTNATGGFTYLPKTAGAPTGVPTNLGATPGAIPFVYDTTNHKLWVYDGAWKGVVLS